VTVTEARESPGKVSVGWMLGDRSGACGGSESEQAPERLRGGAVSGQAVTGVRPGPERPRAVTPPRIVRSGRGVRTGRPTGGTAAIAVPRTGLESRGSAPTTT